MSVRLYQADSQHDLLHQYNKTPFPTISTTQYRRLPTILSLLGPISIHTFSPQPLLILASIPQSLESLVYRALLFRFVPVTCVKVCGCVLEQPFAANVRYCSDELDEETVRQAFERAHAGNNLRYRSSRRIHCIPPTPERYPDP